MKALALPHRQVLTIGKYLADKHVIDQVTDASGRVAYAKVTDFANLRRRILRFATHPKELERLPTKVTPAPLTGAVDHTVHLPRSAIQVRRISVEDIDSFRRTKMVKQPTVDPRSLSERDFKAGIQRIIGETGKYQDWGGEGNDLFTTAIRVGGKRLAAAFGLKGPGAAGVLTMKKLGKNGDQIVSLFQSPADLYVLQYCGQIHESVIKEMKVHADIKSVYEQRRVLYATINGDDTSRLLQSYAKEFARR